MAESIKQTVGVVGHLARARIRSDYEYRTSFWMMTLAQASVTGADLLAVLIIVDRVPELGGWNRNQILVLFGLVFTSFNLADILWDGVTVASRYVRLGEFDRLLLRPLPPLLQLVGLEFEPRRIGRVVPAVATLIVALNQADIGWGWSEVALVATSLIGGYLIFSSTYIAGAAAVIVVIDGQQATNLVIYGSSTAAQYPLHIYPGLLRLLLGWVVPVGFAAYIPAIFLLDAPNPLGVPRWMTWLCIPVGCVAFAGSLLLWRRAVNHHRSTGS